MLRDGGRFLAKICPQCFNILAIAIIILSQNITVSANECRRDGNNLWCDKLLLKRLPTDGRKLQEVENLMVTSNQINEIKPYEINKLPVTLTRLDLTDNQLVEINFAAIASKLTHLRELIVSKNLLKAFALELLTGSNHSILAILDLSYNQLRNFSTRNGFLKIQKLDLKFNELEWLPTETFQFMPNLQNLDLSGNHFSVIHDFFFRGLYNLKVLHINFMPYLLEVSVHSFVNLSQLEVLEISNNHLLKSLDTKKLISMTPLHRLDLSSNSIKHLVFPEDIESLTSFDISNNSILCDCSTLGNLNNLHWNGQKNRRFNMIGFSCTVQMFNHSYSMLDDAIEGLRRQCQSQVVPFATSRTEIWAKVGKPFLINCSEVKDMSGVVWLGNRKEVYTYLNQNLSNHKEALNDTTFDDNSRIEVLTNGSLVIKRITQRDGGTFVCIYDGKYFNGSDPIANLSCSAFTIRLDYTVLLEASFWSMVVGAGTSAGFFVAAVVLGALRYTVNTCSKKEKRKKKSIKEVLEKMNGFTAAQMDRFSAYRNAKMDQLIALKSATIDQLSAFKSARVDKLRTYKQATMTTILHHMDKMRDHYTTQSTKIKENCSNQVDRLRDTYEVGCGRLKDYRSQRMERVRDNYNCQVFRVREYGMQQMSRLREQYKMQQQYLLKLLELIDVGNCVTVLEAECLKTESVIFDADITFDLEPRPIRMTGDTEMGRGGELYIDPKLMERIFGGGDDDDGDDDGDDDRVKESMGNRVKRMHKIGKTSSLSSSPPTLSPSSPSSFVPPSSPPFSSQSSSHSSSLAAVIINSRASKQMNSVCDAHANDDKFQPITRGRRLSTSPPLDQSEINISSAGPDESEGGNDDDYMLDENMKPNAYCINIIDSNDIIINNNANDGDRYKINVLIHNNMSNIES